MSIETANPATGELLAEYEEHSAADVDRIIEDAQAAFGEWRQWRFSRRGSVLQKAAQLLRRDKESYAQLMAREMGKPITQGLGEVEKCAWVCEYYAENAAAFLAPEPAASDARKSLIVHRPLGVILGVMPWNFPFWQVFRFAATALAAGNACVLKHASNVTGSAIAIEKLFVEAGIHTDAFRTLVIPGSRVREALEHPRVRGMALTGSTEVGKKAAAVAASQVKKTVLELGGSDPYLVLDDADIDLAATTCANARLLNSGQSCIAAKRFIVMHEVAEAFTERFLARMRAAVVGDPLDAHTEVGPLARRDLREELHDQVQRTVAAGATIALGGSVPDGPGNFYPPTVLTEVRPDMPAAREELFGPVASITVARNEEEAIEFANAGPFGLGAAVFTADLERGERIAAERIDAGSCFVNGAVKSDPRLPFGGIKESGYGRELSRYGILEFVNTKTVWIR